MIYSSSDGGTSIIIIIRFCIEMQQTVKLCWTYQTMEMPEQMFNTYTHQCLTVSSPQKHSPFTPQPYTHILDKDSQNDLIKFALYSTYESRCALARFQLTECCARYKQYMTSASNKTIHTHNAFSLYLSTIWCIWQPNKCFLCDTFTLGNLRIGGKMKCKGADNAILFTYNQKQKNVLLSFSFSHENLLL